MYLSAVLSYVIFFCVPRFFDWGYLMDYMQLMAQADELSLRGLGMTAPNPIVGALLIDSQGLIIAQEFHNSGLHAEAKAINKYPLAQPLLQLLNRVIIREKLHLVQI